MTGVTPSEIRSATAALARLFDPALGGANSFTIGALGGMRLRPLALLVVGLATGDLFTVALIAFLAIAYGKWLGVGAPALTRALAPASIAARTIVTKNKIMGG